MAALPFPKQTEPAAVDGRHGLLCLTDYNGVNFCYVCLSLPAFERNSR